MDSLRKLEELFGHFPGIGPRQARRFVYYLLNKSPSYINDFTKLIEEVRKSTSECKNCHRLFIGKVTGTLCSVCADKSRDQSILMVVARDSDFETIERSRAYRGLYFVLGGTVPILDKEPEKRIRLQGLLERAQEMSSLKETILSLNATPEGEHTATIIRDALLNLFKDSSMTISLLGRGISTGTELEYVDGDTIRNALQNRRESFDKTAILR